MSYLRLGHVFVANMTGNVVFLGFAAAGATVLNDGAAPAPAAAILVLLANTAIAWQASSSPSRWANPT